MQPLNPEKRSKFWETTPLDKMSPEEWESLCDGCARCCLFKLKEETTGEIFYTNVVCRLLDTGLCQCTDYPNRHTLVPTCLVLDPELVNTLDWLPETCAYRLLNIGEKLAWWHPLVSGSKKSIHLAGISVRGKTISESDIDMDNELEDYIVDWLK
jgi:uncharacterized protein